MIIDLILDRKDGVTYDPREFYWEVWDYRTDFSVLICAAFDLKDEDVIKSALCLYVKKNDYSEHICDYINSVNWLSV